MRRARRQTNRRLDGFRDRKCAAERRQNAAWLSDIAYEWHGYAAQRTALRKILLRVGSLGLACGMVEWVAAYKARMRQEKHHTAG